MMLRPQGIIGLFFYSIAGTKICPTLNLFHTLAYKNGGQRHFHAILMYSRPNMSIQIRCSSWGTCTFGGAIFQCYRMSKIDRHQVVHHAARFIMLALVAFARQMIEMHQVLPHVSVGAYGRLHGDACLCPGEYRLCSHPTGMAEALQILQGMACHWCPSFHPVSRVKFQPTPSDTHSQSRHRDGLAIDA